MGLFFFNKEDQLSDKHTQNKGLKGAKYRI